MDGVRGVYGREIQRFGVVNLTEGDRLANLGVGGTIKPARMNIE